MSSELLPKAPSGGSSFGQWLESLKSFVRSSRIIESPDVKPTITSQGTVLRIKRGAGGSGATGVPSWRGEWIYWETDLEPGETPRPRRYAEGDMVIRGGEQVLDDAGTPILLDGSLCGTWIARRALSGGEEPGVPTPAEIAANVFDWDLVARFATPTFVVKRSTKKITVGTTASDATIYFADSAQDGSINISLTAAQGKTISLRELRVCQNGVFRKMIVLGSELFD